MSSPPPMRFLYLVKLDRGGVAHCMQKRLCHVAPSLPTKHPVYPFALSDPRERPSPDHTTIPRPTDIKRESRP